MKNKENILWGIVFLAIGVVLCLNVLGLTSIDLFFDGWWTFIIIIPALINVVMHPTKLWPYVWTIIGFVFFLMARGTIQWDILFKMIFPVALVAIGVTLICSNFIDKKIENKMKEEAKNGANVTSGGKSVNFGEKNINFGKIEFKGDSIDCNFGYMRYFMQEIELKENQILKIDVAFGKVDVYVPKNVNVAVLENVSFGSINNRSMNGVKEDKPTLTINASCSFGGINII